MTIPKWLASFCRLLQVPSIAPAPERKDALAHVPRYDRKNNPPDDVLRERGLAEAVRLANEDRARNDPLAHVPRYDKTKEPPDDVLDERELLEASKRANAVLSKKQTQ